MKEFLSVWSTSHDEGKKFWRKIKIKMFSFDFGQIPNPHWLICSFAVDTLHLRKTSPAGYQVVLSLQTLLDSSPFYPPPAIPNLFLPLQSFAKTTGQNFYLLLIYWLQSSSVTAVNRKRSEVAALSRRGPSEQTGTAELWWAAVGGLQPEGWRRGAGIVGFRWKPVSVTAETKWWISMEFHLTRRNLLARMETSCPPQKKVFIPLVWHEQMSLFGKPEKLKLESVYVASHMTSWSQHPVVMLWRMIHFPTWLQNSDVLFLLLIWFKRDLHLLQVRIPVYSEAWGLQRLQTLNTVNEVQVTHTQRWNFPLARYWRTKGT